MDLSQQYQKRHQQILRYGSDHKDTIFKSQISSNANLEGIRVKYSVPKVKRLSLK